MLWLKLLDRVELGIQKPSFWKVCFQTDMEFLLGLVFMMISLLQNRKTSKWWFLQNCYSYRRFMCFEKIQFCDIACVTTVGLYFNDMNSLWGTNTYITSKIRLRFYFELTFPLVVGLLFNPSTRTFSEDPFANFIKDKDEQGKGNSWEPPVDLQGVHF